MPDQFPLVHVAELQPLAALPPTSSSTDLEFSLQVPLTAKDALLEEIFTKEEWLGDPIASVGAWVSLVRVRVEDSPLLPAAEVVVAFSVKVP